MRPRLCGLGPTAAHRCGCLPALAYSMTTKETPGFRSDSFRAADDRFIRITCLKSQTPGYSSGSDTGTSTIASRLWLGRTIGCGFIFLKVGLGGATVVLEGRGAAYSTYIVTAQHCSKISTSCTARM